MTWNMNVFDVKHLRISSSVHEVRMSFSTIWANNFAMICVDDFIIHTSRNRKNALNFFWVVIDASLKFSAIYSTKSTRNEFHKSSSSSSSHSRILFSRIWFLDSYFFFDFSLSSSSICSSLSVDFSLSRVETRLRLENDDSKAILQTCSECRFAEMSECRLAEMNECEIEKFEIKDKRIWD